MIIGLFNFRRLGASLSLLLMLVLTGCTTSTSDTESSRTFDKRTVESRVKQKISKNIKDSTGWAQDITAAFKSQNIAPSDENICSVLAVAEQESNLQVDPAVPGLSKIAWREIDRRAEKIAIPAFLVRTALLIKSPTGESYASRLDSVKTERQLSAIFEDFIGMVPMGKTLFGSLNPVHTGGPMQVSIDFAQQHASDYPWKMAGTVRQEVFTRRGGVWFGTYHLLNYPANYKTPLYRFADFNAGWYASRNAAFQNAVNKATGGKLALDGDLVRYDSDEPGNTEQAVRKLARQLEIDNEDIHSSLKKSDSIDFEKTTLYRKVYALAESQSGQKLPREILPGITLKSPKITRELTTAWFARRVAERQATCMQR